MGELLGFLGGTGLTLSNQKDKKNSMDISSEKHCGICIILYLFHLIFKILFFFQFLYILTLKIIIDMQSVSSPFVCQKKTKK